MKVGDQEIDVRVDPANSDALEKVFEENIVVSVEATVYAPEYVGFVRVNDGDGSEVGPCC